MNTREKTFAVTTAFFIAGSFICSLLAGCGGISEPTTHTLQSMTPLEVVAGTGDFTLNLTGTKFDTGLVVTFGATTLIPRVVSPTQLSVLVPAFAIQKPGTVHITVTGSSASNALHFTINNPVPSLLSISQSTSLLNSASFPVEIVGTNFVSNTTVNVGGLSLVPTSISPTRLSVVVPESVLLAAAILPVTVSNSSPGGGTSSPLTLTVLNPVPVLSSLPVSSTIVGGPDFALNIMGTGFAPGVTVNFGSLLLIPTAASSTQLTVQVPAAAIASTGVVAITAANIGPGGGVSSPLDFTVENPVPTLSSLSLTSVPAGNADFVLDLAGTQFVATSKVKFGNVTLTPTSSSPTQLSVVIPAAEVIGGGLFPVAVTNPGPGGGMSNAQTFTVVNPVPVATSLSQQNALIDSPAFPLQIAGSGFVPQSTVMFGSTTLIPSSVTPTLLTVLVSQAAITAAGTGPTYISVVNPTPGGGTSNSLRFIIQNPEPALATINPPSVTADVADYVLTISGSHFVPGVMVTVGDTVVTPLSVQPETVTVAIPVAQLIAGSSIVISVENPGPGGGPSNALTLIVHGKAPATWNTVVNNTVTIPNSGQTFKSYNQPSINTNGTVVFKGQGSGQSGPTVGIYVRSLFGGGNHSLSMVADNTTAVPQPNNTSYNGGLATFIQFTSIPRIDISSDSVAFRGQSQPVWTYTLPDGTESRAGSAGIFSNPTGSVVTGVGLLGAVPQFSYYQVPGAPAGTRFDQFPGSPSVTGNSVLAFKGNYTVGTTAKTGVFYRDTTATGGESPVVLVANSDTIIPIQPAGGTVVFGSTAPPSAANGMMAFAGFDNEDNPTLGGIYLAPLDPSQTLRTIVSIGDPVPGEAGNPTFNRFGESLAYDGHFIAFWGAWGSETKIKHLDCAIDGNKDLLAYCNAMYPNGYDATEPVNQGVFVYDLTTEKLTAVSKSTSEFDDFIYWVFSGRPPGVGGATSDELPEPPRWRSSSFVAVSGRSLSTYQVAFKATTGSVDGIYLAQGPDPMPIQTVIDTTMPGTYLDTQAPTGSTIATVGLERESLRGDRLVVTASMLDATTTESGAGIYVTSVVLQ